MSFLRKIFSPIIWGNLLLMSVLMVALIVGAWFGMAAYTRHGQSVDVPNVKSMLLGDAEYALYAVGLKATVVDSAYDRSCPPGSVLEQIPISGSKVKEGREIFLTLNRGQMPTLVIPDIADNSSLREAEAKLKSMGFKLGPVEYASGEKDWVLAVKCRGKRINAGEQIPMDVPVVLVVGNDASEFDTIDDDYSEDSMESESSITIDNLLNE